jgi:hypothetical protein
MSIGPAGGPIAVMSNAGSGKAKKREKSKNCFFHYEMFLEEIDGLLS